MRPLGPVAAPGARLGVVSVGAAGFAHALAKHAVVALQGLPQPPQFPSSFVMSTQAPEHDVRPGRHVHFPALHAAPTAHAVPSGAVAQAPASVPPASVRPLSTLAPSGPAASRAPASAPPTVASTSPVPASVPVGPADEELHATENRKTHASILAPRNDLKRTLSWSNQAAASRKEVLLFPSTPADLALTLTLSRSAREVTARG